MRALTSAYPSPRIYWIPAVAILIASCSSTGFNMNSLTGPANTPPAYQADQIVGKYGLAAYQRDEDRTRTEAEARRQCRQPYEIVKGPGGGVLMHLADQSEPTELQLKGAAGGKTFIGPEGDAGGEQDREVVSFDGKVLVLRWVDAEVASRYGTAIYVRCDSIPATKRKAPPRKKAAPKAKAAAPAKQLQPAPVESPQPNAPVFTEPPRNPN